MADKDFNNIDLPEGFSGSELKASMWWVEHKDTVRAFGVVAFILSDIVLILIGLWGLFDWLLFGGVQEERDVRQLTSAEYFQFASYGAIREVRFDVPVVLALPNSRYDVLVPVENENLNYWLELGYRIKIGGEDTPIRKAFVLPGQSKFLAELAIERNGAPGSVELKVETREWHRLDAHEVPDYATFSESRLRFGVSPATYTPNTGDAAGGVTHFTLSNDTAFTYLDTDLLVLLYRADALVAVNKIRLDRLMAGEKRPVDLFWFQSLPQITRTDVMVDVNILDPNVYEAIR